MEMIEDNLYGGGAILFSTPIHHQGERDRARTHIPPPNTSGQPPGGEPVGQERLLARLRQLAGMVADVRQEEQRRLAGLLHDDVAQILAACSMKLAGAAASTSAIGRVTLA